MNGYLVSPAGLDMTIQTVVSNVELTADEPATEGQIPFANGVPWRRPRHQLLGLAGPECLVIHVGLVVEVRPNNERISLEIG